MKNIWILLFFIFASIGASYGTEQIYDSDVRIGDQTDANVTQTFDLGAGGTPKIRFNSATDKFEVADDGSTFDSFATDGELNAHINDTVDAHDASAISVSPSGNLSSTDAQAALVELQGDADSAVHQTGNESVAGTKTFTGKITASTTSNGFHPCPTMTGAQRDAIVSPASGDCVFNSTTSSLNIYSGSAWVAAGGGLSAWVTAFSYTTGDIVIQSSKIYQAASSHTSGTFATDLSGGKWTEISATNLAAATGVTPIANGGTNSSTALSGSSIVISDGSKIVQGAAGTSTTLLHGNASGAPTYGAVSLTADVSGQLPLASGGTNKNMTPVNGGVVWTDADSEEVSAAGTSGQYLQSNGAAAPTFGAIDISTASVTGTLPVNKGGTGAATLTANNVILGNGTSAVGFVAPSTSGNVLQSNGTTWTSVANPAAPAANTICSGETGGCDVQMVVFGASTGCLSPCTTGTCTICQQVGTKITSVTFSSTGSYNLNGLDQTKWACSASGHSNTTGQFYVGWTSPTNGSASSVNVQFGVGTSPVNTGGITAICVGKP